VCITASKKMNVMFGWLFSILYFLMPCCLLLSDACTNRMGLKMRIMHMTLSQG
jgi:hypothetical protein